MTRIDDVAALIEKRLALCDEMCVEPNSDRMAEDLLDEGHLLPDLPEPYKSIDGSRHWGHGVSWYPEHGLCRWEDGVGGSTTAEALRQEAAELLAAASYAERNKE